MAFLTITSGEAEGLKIEANQDEISIGRSDQNVIPLDDPAISSKHCVILKDGNKYTIKDLHSTNGTRLNGKNVSEARLKPGDIIMVGAIEIVIDGPEIEVDLKREQSTTANGTPTIISTPPRSTARNLSGTPPSPAFQAKRDNRTLYIGLTLLGFILVAAAMVWFLLQVFKK